MSILSEKQDITPEWLQANGWTKDGWGSLYWRKTHNAGIWYKEYEYLDNWGWSRIVEVIWFPKDFEGYVVDYGYDMGGKVFFNLTDSMRRNPVHECEDAHDLTTFISATLKKLAKLK